MRAVAAPFDTLQEEAHRESIDFGDGLLVWFMWAIQAAIKSGVSRADVLGAIEQGGSPISPATRNRPSTEDPGKPM